MRVKKTLSLASGKRPSTVHHVQNTATDTEKPPRVRGDLLARLRAGHKNADIRTQQGLGTHSGGVATRTVARAEDGHASFETVERLAKTLGVSPWELWIPLDPQAAPPTPASDTLPDGFDLAAAIGQPQDPASGETAHAKLNRILAILESRP